MNRMVRFETAVRAVLVCVLLLAVVIAAGCSKKQDQARKTSSDVAPRDETSPQGNVQVETPAVEVNTENSVPPPPPPEAAVNKKDTGGVRQTVGKKVGRPLSERKKVSLPAEANAAAAPETPSEPSVKRFESLAGKEEKVDWIAEFSESHPESTVAMVDKALDDSDVAVRSAAMGVLIDKELDDPEVVRVAAKALKDNDEEIRQNAVEACGSVNNPEVGKVLVQALSDVSEDVRTAALQVADQKDTDIRLEVLKAGISSPYGDVKGDVVSSLIDVSSPAAVDILITGLKDPDAEFRDDVRSAVNFLVSQEFETYEQAKSWWDANRKRFDDELFERDDQ
jgi:hypothetical protein